MEHDGFVGLSCESYSLEDLSLCGNDHPDISWIENCSAEQYIIVNDTPIADQNLAKSASGFQGHLRIFVKEATDLWIEKG